MEAPVLPALRPLRLGELLDQAIRIYRRNFLTFVGIIALVYIPYALLQILFTFLYTSNLVQMQADPQSVLTSPGYWLSLAGMLITSFIYLIIVSGLGTAALTQSISRSYLGHKTGILEAYQELGVTWVTLLLTLLLFALLYLGAIAWVFIPCVGWFTGLGLVVFLAGVVAQLIAPIVVIEKLDPVKSLARAWDLARRRFWWLLGFALIFYLFNVLVVSGPTALVSYLTGIALGQGRTSVLPTLISTVAGTFIHLLILPIQMTAWTLVYFDLRVRTEGFDLALLTMTGSENPQTDISSLPTAAPTQQWLTGDDVGRFVIMTIAGAGLFALVVALLLAVGIGISSLAGGL